MTLGPRGRFVVSMLVSWPIGLLYLTWLYYNGYNILTWYRAGYVTCDSSAILTLANGCTETTYTVTLAWAEVVVVTGVVVGIGLLLGRWVIAPVRRVTDTVSQFGPNSLGLRLRATGRRDEVRRLSDTIDAMLDRLSSGYEAQQRFAAAASHELRTPLATQRALVEVSLAEDLTTEQQALLARQLLATNERNEALVDGLLVLGETERGLMSESPVRLDEVTAAVLESSRPFAASRGVSVRHELEPTTVVGEAALLERLVTNLVQNAVKYNEPGGWVDARVESSGVLTVSNSGPQVAPDQVALLFEAFRRASGERLDHSGGAGLGLTIVRSIVTAHGGRVEAVAAHGGGLRVVVGLRTG